MTNGGDHVGNGFIARPSASEVLLFADCLANSAQTDRAVASEALQKWLDGNLTEKEVTQYKVALQFPQQESEHNLHGSAECAACIAGCCFIFGCNAGCLAACTAGVCK